ncbi:MAG: nucleotidyltransferase family protein [Gammaproteobacteria bacterium]
MRLEKANQLANEVIELLNDYSKQIAIAGSTRRKKPEVGDIEVLAEPKDPLAFHMLIIKLTNEDKIFQKGEPNKIGAKAPFGKRYYRLIYNGEQLDLFVVLPPANWNVIFLIRTGSATFTHDYMIDLLINGYHCKDGQILDSEDKIQKIESEEDCFKLIGKEYIRPEERV